MDLFKSFGTCNFLPSFSSTSSPLFHLLVMYSSRSSYLSNMNTQVSCSDKILGWNVLGLQGSLLASLLTAPIYLRSITIGGKSFSHGAVARALCCRAAPGANRIAAPYALNHPALFYVGDHEVPGQQEPAGHGGHKLSALAWCWSHGDAFPELLDCRTGRPVHAMQVGLLTSLCVFL